MSTTTTLTKTIQTELKAITNVSAAAQSISSTLTITTGSKAAFFIDVAPEATNVPGTEFRIEASQKASGDDTWVTLYSILSSKSTVNSNAVDGTEAVGSTVIEETTTTGLALGQIVFFKNSTIGNSEWGRIVALSASTSFTLLDGLTNAQTGSTWYNQAERFELEFDVEALTRLRVVCNNNYAASSVAINWRCACITLDSFVTV